MSKETKEMLNVLHENSAKARRRELEEKIRKEKEEKKDKRVMTIAGIVIVLVIGIFLGIAIYQLITTESTYTSNAGDYTCRGGIIKICSGSKEVSDYLE